MSILIWNHNEKHKIIYNCEKILSNNITIVYGRVEVSKNMFFYTYGIRALMTETGGREYYVTTFTKESQRYYTAAPEAKNLCDTKMCHVLREFGEW